MTSSQIYFTFLGVCGLFFVILDGGMSRAVGTLMVLAALIGAFLSGITR